jgi:TPP-dependent 2-oxoacid decarboxylase
MQSSDLVGEDNQQTINHALKNASLEQLFVMLDNVSSLEVMLDNQEVAPNVIKHIETRIHHEIKSRIEVSLDVARAKVFETVFNRSQRDLLELSTVDELEDHIASAKEMIELAPLLEDKVCAFIDRCQAVLDARFRNRVRSTVSTHQPKVQLVSPEKKH